LLRGLAKYHDVTLLSFTDQPDAKPEPPEIHSLCSDVYVIPWREFNPDSLRARFGFLSLTPRSIIDTFSSEMALKIVEVLSARHYDLVIASQLSMAAYRPYFKNVPALFEEVEIGLSYDESHLSRDLRKRIRHTITWFKLRFYLARLLRSFQACTVVSEQERQFFLRVFPKYKSTVEVISNCLQLDEYEHLQPTLKQNQLIFSGSFRYHANYEAMIWFICEVYPLILEHVPDVHLVITGDHANLPLPPAPRVTLVGYVDDIKSMIASSWISIAPLLSGGGTRLKILEAMAVGTPVVSTSKGAEGLDSISDEHLLVADSPSAFANQVIKLLNSKTLRARLSMNGKRFVKENYNWDFVFPRFLHLLENIVGDAPVKFG
jgi:glycosyltransferase involved in cell wall biosynthesis